MQEYPVLVPLSACYSGYEDRLSTRYSPVRHSTKNRSPFRVRLACVKHAASVRSEPGSNSPVQCLANHFDQTLVRSLKTNFLARSSCSVFKDQAPGSSPSQSPPFYPITKDLSNPFPLPQKLFPRPKTLASHPVQAPAAAEPPLYPIPQTLVKRSPQQQSRPYTPSLKHLSKDFWSKNHSPAPSPQPYCKNQTKPQPGLQLAGGIDHPPASCRSK